MLSYLDTQAQIQALRQDLTAQKELLTTLENTVKDIQVELRAMKRRQQPMKG